MTIEEELRSEIELLRNIIRTALIELPPPAYYGPGSIWDQMLEVSENES